MPDAPAQPAPKRSPFADEESTSLLVQAVELGWLSLQKAEELLQSIPPEKLESHLLESGLLRLEQLEQLRDTSVRPESRLFGQLALEKQLITGEQLEQALREQVASPVPLQLGQILLKKGWITLEQFLDVLREQRVSVWSCQGCARRFNLRHHEAVDVPRCLRCGGRLRQGEPISDEAVRAAADSPRSIPGLGVGVRIGRYVLVREVARGGMGVIFEATDPELGRRVALKLLTSELASQQELRRLHREAALAGKLRHPNIATIHEVGMEKGVHFIAMDFIEGGTLAERLKREGALPPREGAKLIETIARAVEYAHREGIVHRDLKPANILLEHDGRPLITDFGLARELEDSAGLTKSGTVMGTPEYMSPEQVRGKTSEVGVRSDVWALGVMLYEATTGRRPFLGDSSAALYHEILVNDPLRTREATRHGTESGSGSRRRIEEDLETVMLKCLEKSPERRYASAGQLVADLERFLRGDPIQARRPTLMTRVTKKIKKHKLASVLVAALSLSILLGLLAVVWQSRHHATKLASTELYIRADEQLKAALMIRRLGHTEPLAEAVEDVQRMAREALQKDAELTEAHFVIGWALRLSDKWKAAVEEYSRYLDQYPDDPLARYERGWCFFMLYTRAREDARRVWRQ